MLGGEDSVGYEAEELEEGAHETSISARGENGHLYDVWCKSCEHIAPADTLKQAQAIARLHEAFIAVLVDKWSAEE